MSGAIELVSEDHPPAMGRPRLGADPAEIVREMNAAVRGLRYDLTELIARKLDKSNELRTDLSAVTRELAFIRKALAEQAARISALEKKAGVTPPQFRQGRGKYPRLKAKP